MNGGYDEGYNACPCFWGREPGSLIVRLKEFVPDFTGLNILDAGCGEGKNAAFLARHGGTVRAIDVSEAALRNAKNCWPHVGTVVWQEGDVSTISFDLNEFHIVVCYGLLHCLTDSHTIYGLLERLKESTKPHGYHVLCAFNDRHHDLTAHPNFTPTLMAHDAYLQVYRDWNLLYSSDLDLHEVHPHNRIPHVHSMTRIIARKDSNDLPK